MDRVAPSPSHLRPLLNHFRHRSEIDGLRGVAVLAVVLYHAGFGCPGGYVGVDVFFVISGFLITSLIWQDLEQGRFTFAHFWERRARRIVPALVVVTVAVLIAGWFFLLPGDFANLGGASAAQAVFAANIHYWRDSGYFSCAAEERPLLHTWSLAVEEQFYLIVPFLFWGMFRTRVLRGRAGVISLLAAGFICSFAVSLYGVVRSPEAAFFLLPTRAWELLLGALAAFLPPARALPGRRGLRELFTLAGLVLILVPVLLYTPETPFPGLAALPPCLGTALVIGANGGSKGAGPTVIGAALSMRPLIFTGLISYSLYLWHWPVLAFSKYPATAPLSLGYRAILLSLGFLLAILSWKYVETPFRERKWGASRKALFSLAGIGLATVFGCGLLCLVMRGYPQRFPMPARDLVNAKTDTAFNDQLTPEDVRAGKVIPLGARDAALRPTVFVWGDSHALAALPAIDTFLREQGLAGRAAAHNSTAPILDWFAPKKYGLGPDSIPFNESVFSYIHDQRIPNVILCARWPVYVGCAGIKPGSFPASLLATIRRLVAIGSRPWILLEVPAHSFNVPKVLSLSTVFPTNLAAICAKPAVRNEPSAIPPELLTEIEAAGGGVIDPKPKFLDATGRHYMVQSDGTVLYRDDNHLTAKGAKIMLLPLFRESLTLKKSASQRAIPAVEQ